jgi:hypothetical protein
MGLIPLGILSSAGGGFGTYELIQTQILTSNAATVTLDSLGTYATTYKHLQIRATVRDSFTGSDTARLGMKFNGDSSSNYAFHGLFARGASLIGYGNANESIIRIAQDTPTATFVTANVFSGIVIDILDPFSSTKFKTVRSLSGFSANANLIGLASGLWRNTAATDSITLSSLGGTSLLSGSRFSLYGIR